MTVVTIPVGMMRENAYLFYDSTTEEGVIIDPGANGKEIAEACKKRGVKPLAILLTHGHFDHIGGVDDLVEIFNIPVYAHEDEVELCQSPELNGSSIGLVGPTTAEVTDTIRDSDEITFNTITFKVLHTPGHTAGGVSYYCEDADLVFSGDTLFNRSVGRADMPTGNEAALIKSIKEKLLVLPEEVRVYSGHGEPTHIGEEKEENPFLQ